jgi:hypothetical protein
MVNLIKYSNSKFVIIFYLLETYHAGAVVRIELKNKDWEIVYGPVQAQDIGQSRIFSPQLRVTRFKTNKVR